MGAAPDGEACADEPVQLGVSIKVAAAQQRQGFLPAFAAEEDFVVSAGGVDFT